MSLFDQIYSLMIRKYMHRVHIFTNKTKLTIYITIINKQIIDFIEMKQ